MSSAIQPTPAPNVEFELSKLANAAMADGADPQATTQKLHDMIAYLRAFPKMAEHATNALADGVASPADITRALAPHVEAYTNAQHFDPSAPMADDANLPPDKLGVGGQIAANAANLAQGIPGAEALEAGARSVVRREPYRQAYSELTNATNQIPTVARYAERAAGAVPLAVVLPGSAAASGAVIGGADEALSANPDESLKDRAVRTPLGAAAGALAGKAVDAGTTGLMSLFTKNPASAILAKQAERAASAKQLYQTALAEGQGKTLTQPIVDFLSEPDISEIVGELKQTRQFANTPEESPEMLDAVYKVLSDRAGQVKKGLDALNPTRPNIGRFRGQDIAAAKGQALDAMSGSEAAPGPMPTYAKAVEDFAQRTREIQGLQQGYEALRTSLARNLPTAKNLTRKTPQAFSEWIAKATPDEIQAARQGILGGAKLSYRGSANPLSAFGLTSNLSNAGKAAALLQRAGGPQQPLIDALQNAGLLTTGSAVTNP